MFLEASHDYHFIERVKDLSGRNAEAETRFTVHDQKLMGLIPGIELLYEQDYEIILGKASSFIFHLLRNNAFASERLLIIATNYGSLRLLDEAAQQIIPVEFTAGRANGRNLVGRIGMRTLSQEQILKS
jgi:hypothetical protein